MVHRIRKTIGKLALAAATRSPIAPLYLPTRQSLVSFDGSLPPHSGRTPFRTSYWANEVGTILQAISRVKGGTAS
jgi:hypothetical protein